MTHTYRAHGLVIASSYDLPMPTDDSGTDPNLTVTRGSDEPVPSEDSPGSSPLALADADGRVFYSFSRTEQGVTLRWPGLCVMRADPGVRHVEIHHQPGIDEAFVSVLVAGALVSLHLTLAGRLVLHASAVEVAGAAMAFVGRAGMGKSTVATLFAQAGHPLVTDDVLHVASLPPQDVEVHRGGLESRLRDKAAALADGTAARRTADGRTAVDLPMTTSPRLPLRACLVPRPAPEARAVTVHRLSPAEGMTALLRFPRLLGWCDQSTLAQQFTLVADLASVIPVAVVDLPWGPPFDPTVPDQLLEALCVNGITAG
ncbi:hypothetical protein [Geodermatophilus sp. SYSU D01036]